MDRRRMLRGAAATLGTVALAGAAAACRDLSASAGPTTRTDRHPTDPPSQADPSVPERRSAPGASASPAGASGAGGTASAGGYVPGPYGPLRPADRYGVALPAGFTSRVLAHSRVQVAPTDYIWPDGPCGGGCLPASGGGWIYVVNGGSALQAAVSVLRMRADGSVASAARVLRAAVQLRAGGVTPWGTWLACSGSVLGRVHEVHPDGSRAVQDRPALGRFAHQGAACDPDRHVVYLTEDRDDGCLYRFRPARWGDLSRGALDVLTDDPGPGPGAVRWAPVADADGFPHALRRQARDARVFDSAAGCWYAGGVCYLSTTGDQRLWALRMAAGQLDGGRLTALHDAPAVSAGARPAPIGQLTSSRSGDLFLAEGRPEPVLTLLTPSGAASPFLRLPDHRGSEITGPAFSPDGSRLYFSSRRGTTGHDRAGVTFEVTGPFRASAA